MSKSGRFDIYKKAVLTIANNLFRKLTHHTTDTFFRILNFFSYLSPCVRGALVNFEQVFFKIEELFKTSFMRLNHRKWTRVHAIFDYISRFIYLILKQLLLLSSCCFYKDPRNYFGAEKTLVHFAFHPSQSCYGIFGNLNNTITVLAWCFRSSVRTCKDVEPSTSVAELLTPFDHFAPLFIKVLLSLKRWLLSGRRWQFLQPVFINAFIFRLKNSFQASLLLNGCEGD